MASALTMEKVIAILKIKLLFACCWPLRPTATTYQKIRNKIFRYLSVLHGMIMIVAIIYTIYVRRSNLVFIMKLSCELCTTAEIPVQIIIYSIQYDRIQYVIYELEDYCKQAKPEERIIFQRYIETCKPVYITAICAFLITLFSLMFSPAIEPHPFPIDIVYPFSIEYQPLKIIIYMHHILIIYQSYTQVCSNIMIALMLWYVSARCEMLSNKFRAVTKFTEFRECIKEHQELLWYGKEVSLSVRHVVLASLSVSTIVFICTGCTFFSKQPIAIKSSFLVFCIASLIKVYLCTWPADSLLSTSTDIAYGVYNSMWINEKFNFQKDLLHTMLRAQNKPITVNVPCLLPTVSLNYYASYVSAAFSYLATFRILVEEED